jgi:soluble lytic murein transglycosylase-like protein
MLLAVFIVGWAAMPKAWRHDIEARALDWLKVRHLQRAGHEAQIPSLRVAIEPAAVQRQVSIAEPATPTEASASVAAVPASLPPAEDPAPKAEADAVPFPEEPVFLAEPESGNPSDDTDTAREQATVAEDGSSDPAGPTVTQIEVASWVPSIPLAVLSAEQAAVAKWLSRRYRVAKEPIARLVHEAWEAGSSAGVDPALVLAVAAIESRFNPFAQSPMGAQGLMQVLTRVHQDKFEPFGGNQAAFDPVANLRVGAHILKDLINRRGGVEEGLRAYVGATTTSGDGYTRRVLSERDYLNRVMRGHRISPHIVARTASTQPAPSKPAPRANPVPGTSESTVVAADDRPIDSAGASR